MCVHASQVADSSDAGGPNPLLLTAGFPRWDEVRPHHIAPAARQVLAEESAALDLLEQDLASGAGALTYERLFAPYTQIRLRVDSILGQAYHLSAVASTPELRDALDEIASDVVHFDLRMGQSRAIYEAASRLRASAWESLDGEQQRVLDILLRDMSGSGVGLAGEQRATFNAIKLRMDELQTQFSRNVMESNRVSGVAKVHARSHEASNTLSTRSPTLLWPQAFKLLVRDRAQLAGLGATALAVLAQNAQAAGYPEATAEAGPWLLKLGSAATSAVVSNAHDGSLRQQVYTAQATVAASGPNDNNPVIEELLALRHQMAQLLGFPTWARYRATSKVCGSMQQMLLVTSSEIRYHLMQVCASTHVSVRNYSAGTIADGNIRGGDGTHAGAAACCAAGGGAGGGYAHLVCTQCHGRCLAAAGVVGRLVLGAARAGGELPSV